MMYRRSFTVWNHRFFPTACVVACFIACISVHRCVAETDATKDANQTEKIEQQVDEPLRQLLEGQELVELKIKVENNDQPIEGAEIAPWALGCALGHGMWKENDKESGVDPVKVKTNAEGIATVVYPKVRVLERKAPTTMVSISIDHPEYAFIDSMHIKVPLKGEYGVRMAQAATIEVRPTLKGKPMPLKGIHALWTDMPPMKDPEITDKGRLKLSKVKPGLNRVMLVRLDGETPTHFSDVIEVITREGKTKRIDAPMRRAARMQGMIGLNVPRPVLEGRVKLSTIPPDNDNITPSWRTWATIQPDGTFTVDGWPPRMKAQVCALCKGFIATSGTAPEEIQEPPRGDLRRAQVFRPAFPMEIKMEPIGKCVVTVEHKDQPIEGVMVLASPNIYWWNEGSQIYCHPLIRTEKMIVTGKYWDAVDKLMPQPFTGTTNEQGVATLELPAGRQSLVIRSEEYKMFAFPGGARRLRTNIAPGTPTKLKIRVTPKK